MQIEQLLQPIEPPPGGLLKLQQALSASRQAPVTPAWRWQTALFCAVGLWWCGSLVYDTKFRAPGADLDPDRSHSALVLMNSIDTANEVGGQEQVLQQRVQGSVIEIPGSNPQVKMFWLMADG